MSVSPTGGGIFPLHSNLLLSSRLQMHDLSIKLVNVDCRRAVAEFFVAITKFSHRGAADY